MQIPGSHRRDRPVDGSTPSSPSASQPKMTPPQTLTLPGGPAGRVAAIGGAVAVVLLAAIGGGGSALFTQTQAFLDFGAGVLALVSLSVTVLWGLAATDRMFLQPNHRLLAQGVHRATAVSGIAFLILHIWVKVALNRTSGTSVVVPFVDVNKPFLIGLGTVASYLFIAVAISGAMRSVFTSNPTRARRWRILHMCAYPAWGAALLHGLKAGRPAAAHITAAYTLCVIAVAVALVLRMNAKPGSIAAKGPRAPLGELPRPERRSTPALPEKPSQDPVGMLDHGTSERPRRDDQERSWSIPAQATREPDLRWPAREPAPLDDVTRVQQLPDHELPWSGGSRPEPPPVPRQEPAPIPRQEPRVQPSRPAYADYPPSWADDPLTGEIPVTMATPPTAAAPPGLNSPGPVSPGPVSHGFTPAPSGAPSGVGSGAGQSTAGAAWPLTPEPSPEPVGAPWPRTPEPGPVPGPGPDPVGTPWSRAPEPDAQPEGSPWSTVRPPNGEPWAPTPDESQTGRRVNGRTQ